ncbi:elongation factor 1-gamma-like protein [Corchorus capsularis]|uniref:Elongation factor 1-gamma-like protein n=1 Tax=Corchorus capsularis TaxID=210143 RepID=A0A1R3HF57_COCAP|nr:elongation factor 1-gamma-like protein [Corchorus capsularis]
MMIITVVEVVFAVARAAEVTAFGGDAGVEAFKTSKVNSVKKSSAAIAKRKAFAFVQVKQRLGLVEINGAIVVLV